MSAGSGGASKGGAPPVGSLVAVSVEAQVGRLIAQAQAHESLSQMFVGWCGFWEFYSRKEARTEAAKMGN